MKRKTAARLLTGTLVVAIALCAVAASLAGYGLALLPATLAIGVLVACD
jgi:hypothetical protein